MIDLERRDEKTYDMYDYIYSIFIRERKGGKSKKDSVNICNTSMSDQQHYTDLCKYRKE